MVLILNFKVITPSLSGGTHVGDSSAARLAGSSSGLGCKDTQAGLAESEMAKIDAFASSRPPVGPSSAGHDIYQGSYPIRVVGSPLIMRVHLVWTLDLPTADHKKGVIQQIGKSSVVNPRKEADEQGGITWEFSVKSGENNNLNIVQSTGQMEQFPISSGSMRSMLRAKQEGQSLWEVNGLTFYTKTSSSPKVIFMQQSTPSLGSSAAAKIHGGMPSSYPVVEPGFSSSMQFSGSSYDNHALVAKMHKEKKHGAFSAMNSSLLEASSEESKTLSIGKVLDHEGGTSNTSGNANKMAQCAHLNLLLPYDGCVDRAGANMVTEMSMLRSATFRDAGKSQFPGSSFLWSAFQGTTFETAKSTMPCLLAFRSLHLEIAWNIYPKEELIDHKGKDYSLNEPSNVPEVPVPFGRLSNVRDTERIPPGSSSSGSLLETDSMSKAEERRHILAIRRKPEADMHTQEVAESQAFPSTASQPDSSSIMGLSASPHEDTIWRKDNTPSQSQSFGDTSVQGNQHSENHLSPFLLRDHWKPVSGMDNDHHKIFQTKEANLLIKHVSRDDSKVTEIQTRCISDGCKAVPIDDTTKMAILINWWKICRTRR
ncbi:hypothetical protein AAG906_024807 [Vitis piasezkii]